MDDDTRQPTLAADDQRDANRGAEPQLQGGPAVDAEPARPRSAIHSIGGMKRLDWSVVKKTELDHREMLEVAYLHLIWGVDQHTLSIMFKVSNAGRIAEAIWVARWAAENHRELHRERMKNTTLDHL